MSKSKPREECAACGKRARWSCPALGGEICSPCCGEGRNTKYECPDSCEKNPFGPDNYSALLKIEEVVDHQAMGKMVQSVGERVAEKLIRKGMEQSDDSGEELGVFLEPIISIGTFYDLDSEGKTVAGRWAEEDYKGLNNDGRTYMRKATRPAVRLLEVQSTDGVEKVEVLDLLDPDARIWSLRDRSLSAGVNVFDVIFAWSRVVGDEMRLRGAADMIGRGAVLEKFLAELKSIVEEDGSEALVHRYHDVRARLREIEEENKQRLIGEMEPDWCRSFFSLNQPEKVIAQLDAGSEFGLSGDEPPEPELQMALERFDWIRAGRWQDAPKTALVSQRISPEGEVEECLGAISVYEKELMLECMGRTKHAYLREELESMFAGLIVFDRETAMDLSAAENLGKRDITPEPHSLPDADAKDAVRAMLESQCRKLIDDEIPMFGHRTPRALAASNAPGDRELLLSWTKDLLQGFSRQSKEVGGVVDTRWVLDELGLSELGESFGS